MTVDIIRQIALTGCRRMEMVELQCEESDTDSSCLRLIGSKEGRSIRPVGLPVVEYLEKRRKEAGGQYVFPGRDGENAFGSFPNHWKKIFEGSALADITPHVLRHSSPVSPTISGSPKSLSPPWSTMRRGPLRATTSIILIRR